MNVREIVIQALLSLLIWCTSVVLVAPESIPNIPSTQSQQQLPPNWQLVQAADGRNYFINTVTRESQWSAPVFDSEALLRQKEKNVGRRPQRPHGINSMTHPIHRPSQASRNNSHDHELTTDSSDTANNITESLTKQQNSVIEQGNPTVAAIQVQTEVSCSRVTSGTTQPLIKRAERTNQHKLERLRSGILDEADDIVESAAAVVSSSAISIDCKSSNVARISTADRGAANSETADIGNKTELLGLLRLRLKELQEDIALREAEIANGRDAAFDIKFSKSDNAEPRLGRLLKLRDDCRLYWKHLMHAANDTLDFSLIFRSAVGNSIFNKWGFRASREVWQTKVNSSIVDNNLGINRTGDSIQRRSTPALAALPAESDATSPGSATAAACEAPSTVAGAPISNRSLTNNCSSDHTLTFDSTAGLEQLLLDARSNATALSFALHQQQRYLLQLLTEAVPGVTSVQLDPAASITTLNGSENNVSSSGELNMLVEVRAGLPRQQWREQALREIEWLRCRLSSREVEVQDWKHNSSTLLSEVEILRGASHSSQEQIENLQQLLQSSTRRIEQLMLLLNCSSLVRFQQHAQLQSLQHSQQQQLQQLLHTNTETAQRLAEVEVELKRIQLARDGLASKLGNVTVQLSMYANSSSRSWNWGSFPRIARQGQATRRTPATSTSDQGVQAQAVEEHLFRATAANQLLPRDQVNQLLQQAQGHQVTAVDTQRAGGLARRSLLCIASSCLVAIGAVIFTRFTPFNFAHTSWNSLWQSQIP